MRLVCENCHATYEVADNAIPEEGREVQCAKCDHIWLQMPLPAKPSPLSLSDTNPDIKVIDPETEEETSFDNLRQSEIEATEFHSFRADTSPSFDAGVLASEAEFARNQREDSPETAPEVTQASPLEALRRKVIDDTPAVPPLPEADERFVDYTEAVPAFEEPTPVDNVAEPEDEPVLTAETELSADAEGVEAFVEPEPIEPNSQAEDATAPDEAPMSVDVEEGLGEEEAPTEQRRVSFRRLGGRKEPAVTSTDAPAEEEFAPSLEPAPPAAPVIEPEAPVEAPVEAPIKRRRQSLAEISSVSAAPAQPTEAPATKPFDLGPAAPEELPETPPQEDAAPSSPVVEQLRAEPIATPDMSPDKLAQRAMEDLDSVKVREEKPTRSMAGGFAIGLLFLTILLFIYSFGPLISNALPSTAPFIDSYVAMVDGFFGSVGIDIRAIGSSLARWLEAIQ